MFCPWWVFLSLNKYINCLVFRWASCSRCGESIPHCYGNTKYGISPN